MAGDVRHGTMRWLARGEAELPSSVAWLAPEEAAQASTMTFTKRRTEYLLRRWVCKQTVATLAGLPGDVRSLARIRVANLPSGAPLVLVDGAEAAIDVSLSDRAGWAVCVAGAALGRIGCDLELVEPRSPGFVTDFLTVAEQSYVAAQPATERDAVVNLIWSAKESGLKVLRTGLRRDTRSVQVAVGDSQGADGWVGLEVSTAEGDVLPGWWRRAGAFLLTVATDSPRKAPSPLAGSADLVTARPVHTWVDHPRIR